MNTAAVRSFRSTDRITTRWLKQSLSIFKLLTTCLSIWSFQDSHRILSGSILQSLWVVSYEEYSCRDHCTLIDTIYSDNDRFEFAFSKQRVLATWFKQDFSMIVLPRFRSFKNHSQKSFSVSNAVFYLLFCRDRSHFRSHHSSLCSNKRWSTRCISLSDRECRWWLRLHISSAGWCHCTDEKQLQYM